VKHAALDVCAFEEADQKALDILLQNGGDLLAYVAVSFAQNQHDILVVKNYIENHKVIQKYLQEENKINKLASARLMSPGVIAKIETRTAVENINEILDVADGLMVARGDLGEQIPAEEVPEIQKYLIRLCNARGKVVITATQMLDSMEKKPVPTRAEATDVFNAILDGTDAVMLSGETSIGTHPIRAIQTMNRIAERAEHYYFMPGHRRPFEQVVSDSASLVDVVTERLDDGERRAREASRCPPPEARPYHVWLADFYGEKAARSEKQHTTDRICEAACRLSEALRYARGEKPSDARQSAEQMPKPMVVPTTSGRTALMISRFRPKGCIIGCAHFERTYRKLLLSFGVQPLRIGTRHKRSQEIIRQSLREAIRQQLLRKADEIVATSGTPLHVPGTTNLIQLLLVTDLGDD
jgi:pyruvate kinase